MQYKYLGRTGLQVSRLALGAMNFGELTDETLRRLDEIWPGWRGTLGLRLVERRAVIDERGLSVGAERKE